MKMLLALITMLVGLFGCSASNSEPTYYAATDTAEAVYWFDITRSPNGRIGGVYKVTMPGTRQGQVVTEIYSVTPGADRQISISKGDKVCSMWAASIVGTRLILTNSNSHKRLAFEYAPETELRVLIDDTKQMARAIGRGTRYRPAVPIGC